MVTYILIFIAKITENCLSTLRLILVANGRKMIGAILQGVITLIWLWSAATVITNINDDIYKIIFFILGSFIGSYLGSLIEEKIAFGNNLLMITMDKYKGYHLIDIISDIYNVNILKEDDSKLIMLIIIPRKKRHNVVNLINLLDKDADIFTLKVLLTN